MVKTWFELLFGFRELTYQETRSRLFVEGDRLCSRVNGASYPIGDFSTPTLADLRERGSAIATAGRLVVRHEAIDDVFAIHSLPENEGALFQVASQFNCLEFIHGDCFPEQGVTRYEDDHTQGPACSLAAAAATVYRNYFVPVGEALGQTRDNQIDNLDGLASLLGRPGQFWKVKNGYTSASEEQMRALGKLVSDSDRERLLGEIKIGVHSQVGVTFTDKWTPVEGGRDVLVSQAFGSAVSCGYSALPRDLWEPLATLALDAAYESTLWVAALQAAEGRGTNKVWLTLLGGGAFANRRRWIVGAINRALERMSAVDLDVRIAHYRQADPWYEARVGGTALHS